MPRAEPQTQTHGKDPAARREDSTRSRATTAEPAVARFAVPGCVAAAGAGTGSPADNILNLQRRFGNRYVQRVLQRSGGMGAEGGPVDSGVERQIEQARGTGHALDATARSTMEESIGADFSAVRVHTGPGADALNQSLGARAFTTGADVFFSRGEYQPGSSAGRELLAHELTHVVQQGAAVERKTVRKKCAACEEEERKARHAAPAFQAKLMVGAVDDPLEREADEVARHVMRAPSIQRKCAKCQQEDEREAHRSADPAAVARSVVPADPARVQRAPGKAKKSPNVDQPPSSSLSVDLDGLVFDSAEGTLFDPGPRPPQLMAMALGRLVGSQYRPELVGKALALIDRRKQARFGGFKDDQQARGGEPLGRARFAPSAAIPLLEFLETDEKLKVDVLPEQRELLATGLAAADAWKLLVEQARSVGSPVPFWYPFTLFVEELGQHGKLLKEYQAALNLKDAKESRTQREAALAKIVAAILPPLQVLETIRLDTALAANDKTKEVYALLWKVPAPGANGQVAPPTDLNRLDTAALFLGWVRSQEKVATDALKDAARRQELVERFGRFLGRVNLSGKPVATQALRDTPGTASYPPFPASLSAVPALRPPLFDAALGTDHRFHMQVEFPTIFDAFGHYAFTWERVRIPDDKVGQPIDPAKLAGQQASNSEVSSIRFGRATRYLEADVHRLVDEMVADLGAPGPAAAALVGANAILRYAGTAIQFGIELLTKPFGDQHLVFPEPGLYLVRSVLHQVLEGEEEVVRAPTVAYTPVLARDPTEMAAAGVQGAVAARQAGRERLAEIVSKLKTVNLDPKERKELLTEKEQIERSLGPAGKALEHGRAELAQYVDDLKAGRATGDLAAAQQQLEQLDKILTVRGKRGLEGGETPVARFVSDLGQNLPLSLEIVDKPKSGKRFHVVISDLTTPKSGLEDGYGDSRDEAVVHGLQKLLEGSHGYGRGRVSIQLETAHTLRIEASLGNLLLESIDNIGLVLSLLAVAAAPFTGGATLAIMIPVGVVGAIPSAYRVIERVQAGTFRFDLENGLELVNIAGSIIGLGRLGAGSLRLVRLGRALLIVGYGADGLSAILMGANLVAQIEAVQQLPEGERAAALTLIIGQTLLMVGIQVGGALAERASQAHTEAKLKAALEPELGAGAATREPTPSKLPTPPEGPAKAQAQDSLKKPPEGLNTPPPEPAPHGLPEPEKTVRQKVDEQFHQQQVASDLEKLGPMSEETQKALAKDDALRAALVDSPLAAAAMKKCNSPCFPPNATPQQIRRLEKLLEKINRTGAHDEAALRQYLYDRRDKLDTALMQLEGTATAGELNSRLDFYNKRGEGAVQHLPAREDPAIRGDLVERAHDIGVKYGTQKAQGDGLHGTGFDNPVKGGRYGQGLDDVRRAGPNLDVGDVYIVEYKGGDSKLAPNQMEQSWVVDNIRRLFNEGGAQGQAWARVLAKALREGRLKGIAYSTPLDAGSPRPTVKIKDWTYSPVKLTL